MVCRKTNVLPGIVGNGMKTVLSVARVVSAPIQGTDYVVLGLSEGRPYDFGVAAVNEAGTGEWAETDEAIRPCPPPSE